MENHTFGLVLSLDLEAMTAQLNGGTATAIPSGGLTPAAGLTVTPSTYGLTIATTTAEHVTYVLTGTYSGTLTFNSSTPYQVCLNGASITGTSGPALDLASNQKAFVVSADGSSNTLADASTSGTMKKKGAIHGLGPLIISGGGKLAVTGNYRHGIYGADYLRVTGTPLSVTTAVRDGIRTVNGFIFDSGTLNVQATGTTEGDESKGIKVEGSETTGTGKGYVYLNGGAITVRSVGKAITAGWDIDEDATTTSTADDPDPFVVVNSGVITLTTTGTPYEKTDGSGGTTSLSPEGIEAKSCLTINGGYLVIQTTDDALNAGKDIVLNGGYLYCASSSNDAIDANGDLAINGGYIVAIGAMAPEGSFDYDDDNAATANAFTITGGTFVGLGGTTARPTSLSQNIVVLGTPTSGSTLAVTSTTGKTAFAFTVPQTAATMVLSSPALATGISYKIYSGGTASGDREFKGLYLDNLSYSGGSSSQGFTIQSSITQLGGRIH